MADARTAGAALAAAGSLVWLLAMLGGTVSSPTVWGVVGVGVGVFLVANAVRLADGPLALSRRAGAIVVGALVVSVGLAAVVTLWQGAGAGVLVLGGLAGIVLWVASSMVVAAAS